MATESILLSGAGIKSCMLATPFFLQYTGAAIASLSHGKTEFHLCDAPSVHLSEG